MTERIKKTLLIAILSLFIPIFFKVSIAQTPQKNEATIETASNAAEQKEHKLNPGETLMEHILDAHEFHVITFGVHHISIPLPVILYSPQKGLSVFMSSKFEHGEKTYNGYRLIDEKYLEKLHEENIDTKKLGLSTGKIISVTEDDKFIESAKVYDLSMTRNVVQMLLALIILVWILISVANKYKKNGVMKAPTGMQNAIEPVITFIRDEVGKSNLGRKYEKYLPYLLTVFFFILINNLFGLLPGSANVTGNIAFTVVLGVISFVVIMLNTNGHYWSHILNPPAPGAVKPILFIVELLGIFTKPFALIIRLFANMIAGHMIITCLILLIFIFGEMNTGAGYGFSPISLAFAVFIYLIEILVAFIQAFIFTNLTAVFISQGFEGGHNDEHDQALYI